MTLIQNVWMMSPYGVIFKDVIFYEEDINPFIGPIQLRYAWMVGYTQLLGFIHD